MDSALTVANKWKHLFDVLVIKSNDKNGCHRMLSNMLHNTMISEDGHKWNLFFERETDSYILHEHYVDLYLQCSVTFNGHIPTYGYRF